MDNNLAFKIHQWAGGILGIYIFVMSLSGTTIVFADSLTQWANEPEQIRQLNAYRATTLNTPPESPNAKQLSIGELIDAVEHQKPGAKVTMISNINRGRLPLTVNISGSGSSETIYADNIRGTVLGQIHEIPFIEFCTSLHHNLLSGSTGRTINGIGGLLLLTITITGAIVWWRGPTKTAAWRQSYAIVRHKNGLPKVRSMHAVVGFWLLPMLTIVSLTGTYLGFAPQIRPLLVDAPVGSTSSQSIDSLVAKATESAMLHALPGTKPHLVKLALPKKQSNAVRLWYADELDLPTEVWIDKSSAAIITSNGPFNCDGKSGLVVWFVRLHFAQFAGIWSKILWALIGWLPALLYVSGIYMWRQKLKARSKKQLAAAPE